MNKEQRNRLQMYSATDGYLDRNAAVWAAIPIVSTYKVTFVEVLNGIDGAGRDQQDAQVFIGKTMRERKYDLAVKLDILDDTLEAYAEDIGDAELLSKASNSQSDYFLAPNRDFEIKAKSILDLLSERVDAMADYGLSVPQIDEVKIGLNTYQERQGLPRTYQIASRVATQDLKELFQQGNQILEKMDKVLKRFKRTNPSFYNGYLAARTIID